MIVSEYQHTKTFLLKDILKIDRKNFLLLTKLKTLFRGLILLVTYMVNQLLKVFMKKELQKPSQEKFRMEKVIKRKGDKWKRYDNSFNSWIDKKELE